MDAHYTKYEITEKSAIQLKKDLYKTGRYQDKETLQIVYPLSDKTFLISSVPGRRQFLIHNQEEIKVFNRLIKPAVDSKSKIVYTRMNDFSMSLINDEIDSMRMLKSELDLRYNLKIEKNDKLFQDLDAQIANRISLIDDKRELDDIGFLLFLYLGEYLRVHNQFTWKLKLNRHLPQFYRPKLFKPGRIHDVSFWVTIERYLSVKNMVPIHYLLTKVQNKK